MRFFDFPLAKLTISLIIGIILGDHYYQEFNVFILCIPGFLLILLWYTERKRLHKSLYFELLTAGLFILIGFMSISLRDYRSNQRHYSHRNIPAENQLLQLTVNSRFKSDSYYNKYLVHVNSVDSFPSSGKMLLKIPKEELNSVFNTDTELQVIAELNQIPAALNPGQFDYRSYMRHQGVNFQATIDSTDILKAVKGSSSLRGIAEKLRSHLIRKLDQTEIPKSEQQLIQALILGEKRELNRELYQDYAAAGAVHMLAVSGLHVGIIYFILKFLLGPLIYLKHGRYLQIVSLVIGLWTYALITGLSASVTRSVFMFTCFGLANLLNRPTNSINNCLISMFILLLITPGWLFHVGFQLSYLAVFSILILHPRLNKLYRPKWKIDKLFWNILTGSLAAQIGITPLTLFYFHQFPGLFMLSNLTLLPLLSSIIGSGLVLFGLLMLDIRFAWFESFYGKALGLINDYVAWIASQDSMILKDINFGMHELFGSYMILLSLTLFYKNRVWRNVQLGLAGGIAFTVLQTVSEFQQSGNELVIFHKNRTTIIGHRNDKTLVIHSNDSADLNENYIVRAFILDRKISRTEERELKNACSFRGNEMIIIDSSGTYLQGRRPNIVVLSGSPKINLDRMIAALQPGILIADGSNYKYLVERWQRTAEKRKLPFHHTGTKGAYVLEW